MAESKDQGDSLPHPRERRVVEVDVVTLRAPLRVAPPEREQNDVAVAAQDAGLVLPLLRVCSGYKLRESFERRGRERARARVGYCRAARHDPVGL